METRTHSVRRHLTRWVGMALLAAGGLTACSDGYDLADEQPDWINAGNSSIYDYLSSSGNYTNTVRLIEDLGYREVLAKTGSKTLFVADDEAFARFFQRNGWGVHSYDDLSVAQKKLLLGGAMINNACQVAYLSSSQAVSDDDLPVEGDCMRRLTSQSIYDSVPVIRPEQMPDNPYWARYREAGKPIVCLSDRTTPPMIHFIEAFLVNRLITNEDCDFLFNHTTQRKSGDANVNGIHMVQQNIRCSNGFLHQMGEVLTPLPSMADLISTRANMQGYAKLLNRFCAPYRHDDKDEMTIEYNRIYGTNIDTLYEKRYFSERSHPTSAASNVATPLALTPDEEGVPGTLKFDPAWNQYYAATTTSTSTNVALQQNMGVMLVPSDEALDRYWNQGAGKVLKDYYGSWDNVPNDVVAEMLNVNMLNSFTGSVPSKFHTVLNDANDELGIKPEHVDSVFMASNGAVYLTNRVFNPVSYVSVTFPALVNENMRILYWGVKQCDFNIYLNSQNTYYSLFIPNNEALLSYIDPVSYGKSETQLFRFHYKPNAQLEEDKVWASVWKYDVLTQTIGDSIREADYDEICNRLEDILDTHIVIGNVEDGHTYYQTKGGSVVKVNNGPAGAAGMTVQGGWQIEQGESVPVLQVYDQSLEGNGKSYILGKPIQTARKSVYDILSEHTEFSAFRTLLQRSSLLETTHVDGSGDNAVYHACPSQNVSLFNTYRYTVYVPTNKAITDLQDDGLLPTWDDVDAETDTDKKDSLRHEIETFLRYHIQDNAYYMGQGAYSGEYETSAYSVNDLGVLSYHKLRTNVTDSGISVTDALGQTRHVLTADGLYNLMAREYQYSLDRWSGTSDPSTATWLYTSSNAVVHQIDGVLQYKQPENTAQ